jgi:hypothetical protein
MNTPLGLFEGACGFCKIEESFSQKVAQTHSGQPTQRLNMRCKL